MQKLKGEEIRFTSLESSMTLKCSRLITKKELKSGNVRGLKKFKMNNLNKLSSPVFTLLIHSIVHLNRIPSEQEWKFIKKISYLNKSEHADCIAWKDYLILDLETSKVSFKFVSSDMSSFTPPACLCLVLMLLIMTLVGGYSY